MKSNGIKFNEIPWKESQKGYIISGNIENGWCIHSAEVYPLREEAAFQKRKVVLENKPEMWWWVWETKILYKDLESAKQQVEHWKTKYQNMVIYLLQLHMIVNGKNYLLKYVGQTVDFEKRQKQHIRDLKQNSVSGKQRMIVEYFKKELELDEMPWWILKDIHKSLEEGRYQFSVVHKAETKKELNCAELAYMFMLDVNMNSFYSEANCYDRDCKICKEYMVFGLPNNLENSRKWMWPQKETFTHDGLNRRRVYLRSQIKQERSQIEYYRKWKAGWLPKSTPKLWEDK